MNRFKLLRTREHPRSGDVSRINWRSAVLHGVFFVSGGAALGFQMIWSRMFATGLGHETPAVLAVVGAIFAGMALGSWSSQSLLVGRMSAGRVYGWLELVIGAWGLATMVVIPWANEAAMRFIGLNPSGLRQWLIALLVPGLVLLPATAAMGATFPALESALRCMARGEGRVGSLYSANTLGAMAGVGAVTLWLMPALGYTWALGALAMASVFCGVTALLVSARSATPSGNPAASSGNEVMPLRDSSLTGSVGLALVGTGLLGIAYEVVGVRVLAQVLENTIYTYAAVLSVYLAGTAAGAALYQRAGRRIDFSCRHNLLLGGVAAAVVLGAWVLTRASALYGWASSCFGQTVSGTWTAELVTAACVFLPATAWMGALFSHLVDTAAGQKLGVGRGVALNTLGSALAPAAIGVLALPHVGSKWGLALIALGYFSLARRWTGMMAAWAGIGLVALIALPSELGLATPAPGERLLAYRTGVMDSVAVVQHPDGNRTLLVNRRFTMGGTGAAVAERRHASIPLLLHANPKRALFLGLGTGITFAGAAAEPGLRADGVELVPEIVELLSWFQPQNSLPRGTDRFLIHVADARRFVRVCPDQYDVIVADLFHPARDGAGALYSSEHFQAIRRRLAPDGLFCQWLPLFQLDDPMLRVIVRTFLDVFPDARVFLLRFNVDTPVLGLVGSLSPQRYSPDYFSQRVQEPGLRERLQADQLRDSFQLLGCFLAGPEALRRYAAAAPLNTDDRPVVLFGAPRANLQEPRVPALRLLRLLQVCSSPAAELVDPKADSADRFIQQLTDFTRARNVYLHGLAAEIEGRATEAMSDYVESARLSAFFTTGYAQVLGVALQEAKNQPESARRLLETLAAAQPERPAARELLQRLFPAR